LLASATLLTISNARAGLHVADPERPERGRDATGVAEEPEPHLVPVADELGEGMRVDERRSAGNDDPQSRSFR
jgi:hypothetical protein